MGNNLYAAIKSVEATFVQGVSTNHTLFNITVGDKKIIKKMSTKISITWKGHLWVFSSDYSTEMPPSDYILMALKNTHSFAWRMRFAYVSGHL